MKRETIVAGLAALVAFVLLWKGVVIVSGFPSFILPPPEAVARRLVQAWANGTIEPHAAATLVEIGLGFPRRHAGGAPGRLWAREIGRHRPLRLALHRGPQATPDPWPSRPSWSCGSGPGSWARSSSAP